jgi:Predicted metal-binding integral membrane protein (DUF2182)
MVIATPEAHRRRISSGSVRSVTPAAAVVISALLAPRLHHASAPGGANHMSHMASEMAPAAMSTARLLTGAAAMVVIMMSAGLVPMARFVRRRTLRRRWWAAPTVLMAYLTIWITVTAAVMVATASTIWPAGTALVLLLAAAAWELSPLKRWSIDACQKTVPLHLRGLRATISEIWFGVHQGGLCMASCWLVMLPMLLGVGPAVILMPVGTTVVTLQRLGARPTRARRWSSVLLIAAAILVFSLSFVGYGRGRW